MIEYIGIDMMTGLDLTDCAAVPLQLSEDMLRVLGGRWMLFDGELKHSLGTRSDP